MNVSRAIVFIGVLSSYFFTASRKDAKKYKIYYYIVAGVYTLFNKEIYEILALIMFFEAIDTWFDTNDKE